MVRRRLYPSILPIASVLSDDDTHRLYIDDCVVTITRQRLPFTTEPLATETSHRISSNDYWSMSSTILQRSYALHIVIHLGQL